MTIYNKLALDENWKIVKKDHQEYYVYRKRFGFWFVMKERILDNDSFFRNHYKKTPIVFKYFSDAEMALQATFNYLRNKKRPKDFEEEVWEYRN